jgi:hypothetical protein
MRLSPSFIFGLAISGMAPLSAEASCGWLANQLGACELGETALKAVDKLTDQVQKSQDLFDRTVPGLRESVDLDALGSSDPKVRAAAAERYRNLAAAAEALNKDGTKLPGYRLVVSYEFDTSKTFHSAIQKALDGTPEEAKLYVQQQSIELSPQTTPKAVNLVPPSEPKVRANLMKKADELLNAFIGQPQTGVGHNFEHPEIVNCESPNPDGYCAGLIFPKWLLRDRSDRQLRKIGDAQNALKNITDKYNNDKVAIESQLVDIVMSAYAYNETRFANPSYVDDWSLADARHYVIIYVDSETFNAQSDWKIEMRIEQVDEPHNSLFNKPTRELRKKDFKAMQVSDPDRIVYWAQREMIGKLSDASLEGDIASFKKNLAALSQETKAALNASSSK